MATTRSQAVLKISVFIFVMLLQVGCFWKLWSKEKPIEEKVFDVYGTVVSIAPTQLVITSEKGERLEFDMVDSSIKGSDFAEGAFVHTYYKIKGESKEVTMVVEKIDD
jgi:hypothetical protein